jgi:hypothetical protein
MLLSGRLSAPSSPTLELRFFLFFIFLSAVCCDADPPPLGSSSSGFGFFTFKLCLVRRTATPSEAELPARGEYRNVISSIWTRSAQGFLLRYIGGKKARGFTCMVERKMLKTWQIDLNFFLGGGDFGFFNFYFTLENSTPPAPLSIDIIQVNPGIWFGSSMSSLFLSFPPSSFFCKEEK